MLFRSTNRNIYDAYINDSDLIGTHSRLQLAVNLTDWMAGEGKDVTNPKLDVDDFIGKSFTTGPDGKLYQLPDQQFANLYWFRKDWFDREDLQKQFKDRYGYDLGVPVNWSAYEDIAEFFSVHVKEIDGVRIYGHMDYGKRAPDLGWRMTDAWLSMAGMGSKGLPNGVPVDEWGIRMEAGSCNPAGASARTLSRLFVKETDMTFGAWRQQARLLKALEMLAGGHGVTVAALELGYQSPSAFIAMFRRALGVSPGRYFARREGRRVG